MKNMAPTPNSILCIHSPHINHILTVCDFMWEIYVKKFKYLSKSTKIKHTKYYQHTYYVIECRVKYEHF